MHTRLYKGGKEMNVFVASWFFPPTTSSEGIVTYKLLRNSQNNYDVFCSTSRQWSYDSAMSTSNDDRIKVYSVETDDIEKWQKWAVKQFEHYYKERKYDCIMTRSTPPESIVIGREIKKRHPEIKWVASLADPVANNPYELKAYIEDNPNLTEEKKTSYLSILKGTNLSDINDMSKRHESGIKLLAKLKKWELAVLAEADLIISPTACQLRYMCGGRWNNKFFPLPHSFDQTFYPEGKTKAEHKKVKLRYIGYSDAMRSLKPIIYAIKKMKEERSSALENLDIEFIGNIPCIIRDMIMNYYLYDYVKCVPSVDYYESLALMQESDWLIHVDAFFPQIHPGGSIFFAGKIADYMGTGKPIFALTGKDSPANEIIRHYGGVCCLPWETEDIKAQLEAIAEGATVKVNEQYKNNYDARKVAKDFDDKLNELVGANTIVRPASSNWPAMPENHQEKLLSICIPSYNVERYLSRCITSLVDYDMAGYTEILVIDDGSVDNTAIIGKEFEKRYPGIVYLHSKENGGHGSTINYAMKIAKGKYFRVVDGDDWVDSRKLGELLKNILTKNIDADVISSNYHEIDIDTAEERDVTQEEKVDFYHMYSFEQLNVENIYLTLASMMVKTDILKKMNVTLQEHAFYVDVEFILYPVPYIKNVMFTPEYIYKYARGNAEQSVALPNMVKRYEHHTKVLKNVLSYEKKVKLTSGQKAYYDAILERLLFTQYSLGLIYDYDKERGYARAKEFDNYLRMERADLYKKIEKNMKMISRARKHNFDYDKVENDPIVKAYKKYVYFSDGTLTASVYKMVMGTSIGRKIRSSESVSKLIDTIKSN